MVGCNAMVRGAPHSARAQGVQCGACPGVRERLLIMFTPPHTHLRRIGRTGRAGRKGTAVTFLTLGDTGAPHDARQRCCCYWCSRYCYCCSPACLVRHWDLLLHCSRSRHEQHTSPLTFNPPACAPWSSVCLQRCSSTSKSSWRSPRPRCLPSWPHTKPPAPSPAPRAAAGRRSSLPKSKSAEQSLLGGRSAARVLCCPAAGMLWLSVTCPSRFSFPLPALRLPLLGLVLCCFVAATPLVSWFHLAGCNSHLDARLSRRGGPESAGMEQKQSCHVEPCRAAGFRM